MCHIEGEDVKIAWKINYMKYSIAFEFVEIVVLAKADIFSINKNVRQAKFILGNEIVSHFTTSKFPWMDRQRTSSTKTLSRSNWYSTVKFYEN